MTDEEKTMKEKLEDALNKHLPSGYVDFDDFVDVVMSAVDFEPSGDEWPVSPHHTGQREDPNDWDSPMRVGVEIQIPELNASVIWDTWNWSVE